VKQKGGKTKLGTRNGQTSVREILHGNTEEMAQVTSNGHPVMLFQLKRRAEAVNCLYVFVPGKPCPHA
jgi:hypothetical protein